MPVQCFYTAKESVHGKLGDLETIFEESILIISGM